MTVECEHMPSYSIVFPQYAKVVKNIFAVLGAQSLIRQRKVGFISESAFGFCQTAKAALAGACPSPLHAPRSARGGVFMDRALAGHAPVRPLARPNGGWQRIGRQRTEEAIFESRSTHKLSAFPPLAPPHPQVQ